MASKGGGSGEAKASSASFWTSLPGFLTGLAALIGAVATLYVAVISRPPMQLGMPAVTATPAPGIKVASVTLRAEPAAYRGPCPVDIKFMGRIEVAGGSGTVTYKFVAHDGRNMPTESLHFDGASAKDIVNHLPIGQAGKSYVGWRQVQILDPAGAQSGRADFHVDCQ